jgi:hypothetical protein
MDQMIQIFSEEDFLKEDHIHELHLNKFADWTDDEYKSMLGFHPDLDAV